MLFVVVLVTLPVEAEGVGVAAHAKDTPIRASKPPKAPAHKAALSLKKEKNRTNDPESVNALV